MKKYVSVFGLFARSSLLWILAVLALMSGAEFFLFRARLSESLRTYELLGSGMSTLESMISRSAIPLLFALAFLAVTVLISLSGCAFRSRTEYTVFRLSVGERSVFFLQAAYNAVVYLLLLAVQAGVAFALCNHYVASAPAETVGNQTFFLAFYRNEFLHALLPMEDVYLWIRNLLLLVSLGLTSAEFPYRQRRGKYSFTVIALFFFVLRVFPAGIGDGFSLGLTAFIALIVIGEALYRVFGERDEEEAETEGSADE